MIVISRQRYIHDIVLRTECVGQEQQAILDKYAHMQGVSSWSAVLALKRGLNPEIAAVAGLLHDIYTYRTGLTKLHAYNGEEEARVILRDSDLFSLEEQALIRSAIRKHSDKKVIDGEYDELLKDADVIDYYLTHPDEPLSPVPAQHERLVRILEELGLRPNLLFGEPEPLAKTLHEANRGELLASIAVELAAKPLVSNEGKSGPDVFPLIRYFPGTSLTTGFDWCASFVFHCCLLAGIILPIKYPDPVSCRFAGVRAWLEWAMLPDIGFWHEPQGFVPERGDIVVFDRLLSNEDHDHIGIVTLWQDGLLITAEGNVENRSGIFNRALDDKVRGFIRIPNSYLYHLR